MPAKIDKQALCDTLQNLPEFAALSLTAKLGEHDEIIIARRTHVRGIWQCKGAAFAWTPTGYSEPVYQAADLAAALAYTRDVIMTTTHTIT